mmetsp:Transcript_26422/g.54097  ORF Transcript_26422/g.54097 Transcript_26422/m.54097 type:complete len:378 (+) Transcript_26422:208-1341(+)
MMNVPTSLRGIEEAAADYGPTSAGRLMMQREASAAEQAIASGIYVTWRPPDDLIGQQCCARIGSKSMCLCGHSFGKHREVSKQSMRPPQCGSCARCPMFRYAPSRPEEVGQWHLPRRKNFDLKAWQQRVRAKPQEYACVGCDSKVSDHVVVVEDEAQRRQAGLSTGGAFMPLAESVPLQEAVFGQTHRDRSRSTKLPAAQLPGGRAQHGALPRYQGVAGSVMRESENNILLTGGGGKVRGGGGGKAMPRGLDLEEQVERGMITAAEYHKQVRAQTLDEDGAIGGGGGSSHEAPGPRSGVPRFKRLGNSPRSLTSRPPLSSASEDTALGRTSFGHAGTSSVTLVPVRSRQDGRPGVVVTNLGRPMPQPGKTWERSRHL